MPLVYNCSSHHGEILIAVSSLANIIADANPSFFFFSYIISHLKKRRRRKKEHFKCILILVGHCFIDCWSVESWSGVEKNNCATDNYKADCRDNKGDGVLEKLQLTPSITCRVQINHNVGALIELSCWMWKQ